MINTKFTQISPDQTSESKLQLSGNRDTIQKVRGSNLIKTILNTSNSITSEITSDSEINSEINSETLVDSKTGCIGRDNLLQYQIDNELGNKLTVNSNGNWIDISMTSKTGVDLGHGSFSIGGVGSIISLVLDHTNKRLDLLLGNNQHIYCYLNALYDSKQDKLVSGQNIKTINNESILGYGNLKIDKQTIGLGQVDNTADLDKPISEAVQQVLDSLDTVIRTQVTKLERYHNTIDFPAIGKANYLYLALDAHMLYSWERGNYKLLNDFSESYKNIKIINGGQADDQ